MILVSLSISKSINFEVSTGILWLKFGNYFPKLCSYPLKTFNFFSKIFFLNLFLGIILLTVLKTNNSGFLSNISS